MGKLQIAGVMGAPARKGDDMIHGRGASIREAQIEIDPLPTDAAPVAIPVEKNPDRRPMPLSARLAASPAHERIGSALPARLGGGLEQVNLDAATDALNRLGHLARTPRRELLAPARTVLALTVLRPARSATHDALPRLCPSALREPAELVDARHVGAAIQVPRTRSRTLAALRVAAGSAVVPAIVRQPIARERRTASQAVMTI